jgi:hypothetical protein
MHMCRNDLHELRTQADRIGTECRPCHYKRQTTYRERQKLALALLRDIESRGISVDDLKLVDRQFAGSERLFRLEKFECIVVGKRHGAFVLALTGTWSSSACSLSATFTELK